MQTLQVLYSGFSKYNRKIIANSQLIWLIHKRFSLSIILPLISADFEPVTMSIQLEYIDGLIFNLTLGLGQPFTVRYDVGERIIR